MVAVWTRNAASMRNHCGVANASSMKLRAAICPRSVADQDFGDRRLHCAKARIVRQKLLVASHGTPRIRRRLAVGGELEADLAAAGQRAQRATLPAEHRGEAVGAERADLERLAVQLLDRGERHAELQAL